MTDDGVFSFVWSQGGVEMCGDISRSPVGLVVTRVEVRAPEGVTTSMLRGLPIDEMLRSTRARCAPQLPEPTLCAPVGPGHIRMTDDLLRDVALAYLKETAPGKDRGATRRMVERFGRPQGTVQSWIKRARKEGWLTPGPSGRMGAEPGPKLLAWRAEQ